MTKFHTPNNLQEMPLSLVKNMIALCTSGFGLVVALAWNEMIKTAVTEYIDPLLGKGGSIASLFIYAIIMTALAVLVTMQLANLEKKLEYINELIAKKNAEKEKASIAADVAAINATNATNSAKK